MTILRVVEGWPPAISDGLTLACSICGNVPEIDYRVTDELWNEIVPKEFRPGVICLRCFSKMASPLVLARNIEEIQLPVPGMTITVSEMTAYLYAK